MDKKCLDLFIELQPKLNEYRGDYENGDAFFIRDEEPFTLLHYNLCCGHCQYEAEDCDSIWVPKAIDMLDPERIARGEKPRGLQEITTGFIGLIKHHNRWTADTLIDGKFSSYVGDSPTEALLLALKQQWEEKK